MATADPAEAESTKPRTQSQEAYGSGERRDLNKNQTKSIRGGKRPGAGRPKGAVNKATADIREAAQAFTDDALQVLAAIMRSSESDAARVAAANSILDRGHGKPKQTAEVDAELRIQIVDDLDD